MAYKACSYKMKWLYLSLVRKPALVCCDKDVWTHKSCWTTSTILVCFHKLAFLDI